AISQLSLFNAMAPPEIYTLSLHDALPIFRASQDQRPPGGGQRLGDGGHRCAPDTMVAIPAPKGSRPSPRRPRWSSWAGPSGCSRSEEHTSELQSRSDLVCRLLLEKKK